MTKLFLLLILLSGYRPLEKKNNCELNLESAILNSWKYDKEAHAFRADEQFLSDLDSNKYTCIYGKDTSFIISKFGRDYKILYEVPPKMKNEGLDLAVSYSIYPCSTKHCLHYQFYFDKKGFVRKIGRLYQEAAILK